MAIESGFQPRETICQELQGLDSLLTPGQQPSLGLVHFLSWGNSSKTQILSCFYIVVFKMAASPTQTGLHGEFWSVRKQNSHSVPFTDSN